MGSLFTWQQPLLGFDHFPSSLTDFEVEYFFSFNDEELRQIKSRRPHLRVGAAIQLGFIKMTGSTLNASERIPLGVMFRLSETLRTQKIHIATTRTLYPRRSTLYEHQAWAAQCLGWHAFTSARRGTLVREITKRLADCPLAIDGIVELLKTWLYQRSILIPAARSLRALAVRLYRITEREAQRVALEEIPPHIVDDWLKDILRRHEDIPTQLEWLQRIPRGRSYNTLSATLQRISYLKHLGVYLVPLKRLSASTQRYYAYRLRNRRPSRLRTMPVDRARLELVCFLSITLIDTTDRAIALFDFQATDLRRRALKRVQDSAIEHDKILRDAFIELHRLCHDETVNDGDFRSRFKLIAPDIYRTIIPKAERVRQELVNDHRRVNALVRIMDEIILQGTLASGTAELRNAMTKSPSKQTQLMPDIPPVWQPIYDASSGKQKQHVLGAVTLVSMQRELRNGALWASNGYVYRDRNALFIEESQWQREKPTWHRQLNLPVSFAHYQRRLSSALTRGLDDLAQAVANGELSLDQDGIHVKHLAGEHEEPIVSKTRKAIFREIGDAQLPDMIISIDQHTRFSSALLGRKPHGKKELLRVYGAVLALGTDLNAHGVSMMMSGVTEASIADMMHVLERDQAMREANRRVIDYTWRHDIVHHWGQRENASADAMSLDVSRHLWNARMDPRRRTPSIGIYTHVSEQWAVIYDQPIVLGRRQAGAAIEGALRQEVVDELKRVSVDTHGYTDFAMALAALLGFELCPRLSHLKDRRLHVPNNIIVPPSLSGVVRRDVDSQSIDPQWHNLVRLTASVHSGHASAVSVLNRFGDHARGDPLYQAGRRLGQLHRSVFLCSYLSNPAYRREIHRALALGESYHILQRALYRGGITAVRGRRDEELNAISGALTLLTNIVLAWNTSQMDAINRRWRIEGRAITPETQRHIGPAHIRHINFRGTFNFENVGTDERLISNLTAN